MKFAAAIILGLLLAGASALAADGKAPTTPPMREVAAGGPNGPQVKLFVFSPANPGKAAPAILTVHGGGWQFGEAAWTFASARRFAQNGVVAIAVEYRLAGVANTPLDALADVCSSLQWVRQHSAELQIDPNRVAVHGVSAGGQLGAAAATLGCGNTQGSMGNGGPDAMLLWSPAIDVADSGWFTKLLRGRASAVSQSPLQNIRKRLPPTSIVQGEKDTLTPASSASAFCAAAIAQGSVCDLKIYPGLGHLLTRNLKNQEDDFDPDPVARDDGIARQLAFLLKQWRWSPD